MSGLRRCPCFDSKRFRIHLLVLFHLYGDWSGVNFINVKCTNFSYERPFLAAFSRYVSALAPKFCTKNACVNVDEIDGWGQFYQQAYAQLLHSHLCFLTINLPAISGHKLCHLAWQICDISVLSFWSPLSTGVCAKKWYKSTCAKVGRKWHWRHIVNSW